MAYNKVSINKNYQDGDIEIGELEVADDSQKENPNLGNKLIRISAKKVIGHSETIQRFEQEFREFIIQKFSNKESINNPDIYEVLSRMNKDNLEILVKQVYLEAGVKMILDENIKQVILYGVFPAKAYSIICLHPIMGKF